MAITSLSLPRASIAPDDLQIVQELVRRNGGRGLQANKVRRALNRQPGRCTWCGGAVGRGRRLWCGQWCVQEFSLLCSWPFIRQRVEGRDQGVCAACGLDTGLLRRMWRRACRPSGNWTPNGRHHSSLDEKEAVRDYLRSIGFRDPVRSFWDADHIQPVCEGGLNDMANLRTLCVPCHRAETKRLSARRAARRKEEQKCIAELTTDILHGLGRAKFKSIAEDLTKGKELKNA